jgi:hypothetical protein
VNKTPSGTAYTEGFGRKETKLLGVLCTPKGYGKTQKCLQDLLVFDGWEIKRLQVLRTPKGFESKTSS